MHTINALAEGWKLARARATVAKVLPCRQLVF